MNSATSIDNNSKFSIGTESQYSATSDDNAQTGGFFSIFGSDKSALLTEMALDAFNERKIKEGTYLLATAMKRKITPDLSKKDANERNLLHLLVLYSAYDPEVKDLLVSTLNRSDIAKYIDSQDEHLNTPAHYALSLGLIDVLKVLVSKGANISVKNDQGYYIKLVKTPLVEEQPKQPKEKVSHDVRPSQPQKTQSPQTSSIFVKCGSQKSSQLPSMSAEYTDDVDRQLDNIVKTFLKRENDPLETIGFRRDDLSEIQDMKASTKSEDINSMDFLNMLMNQFRDNSRPAAVMAGGANKNSNKKSNVATGRRRMNTYSEISIGGATTSDDDDTSSLDEDMISDMARSIKNKTTEIHEDTVKKIMEIMGVSEDVARNYKAALYQKVKSEQPNLNGYDRAVEMQKLATKDVLKKIDIEKVTADIKAHIEEKQKSSSEEPKEKKTRSSKAKPKATSSSSSESEKPKAKRGKKVSESITSDSGLYSISTIDV